MPNQLHAVRRFMTAMEQDTDRDFNTPDVVLSMSLIEEEYDEVMAELRAIMERTLDGVAPSPALVANLMKELADLLYVVNWTAARFGLHLNEAFWRVHESNMSKLVDGKPLKRADGKVLKGPNYHAPDLLNLIPQKLGG